MPLISTIFPHLSHHFQPVSSVCPMHEEHRRIHQYLWFCRDYIKHITYLPSPFPMMILEDAIAIRTCLMTWTTGDDWAHTGLGLSHCLKAPAIRNYCSDDLRYWHSIIFSGIIYTCGLMADPEITVTGLRLNDEMIRTVIGYRLTTDKHTTSVHPAKL